MDATNPENENLENGSTVEAGGSNEDLLRLQDELNQTRDQLLRTMADFQNFRKRQQDEATRIRTFANESFAQAMLPVLDNFGRTLAHLEAGVSVEQLTDGIRAVERQLRAALESQNVIRIESVGKPFDPAVHEAIVAEAAEGVPAQTVLEELEAGYRIGDRVIRPARVKVASGE